MTKLQEYKAIQVIKESLRTDKYKSERVEDWATYTRVTRQLKELDERLKTDFEWVNVSASIGSRNYYRSVIKIGKGFYDRGEKMTAGRGWWGVEEIPEITDDMRAELLSDSYYY